MSKRLFIWIGLIVLIGVIAAAGWSLYTTLNRPAVESSPPVARGKIPQMPATASGKVIHRARIQDQTPRQPEASAVPDSNTPKAASPEPSARVSPGVTVSSAIESAARTDTAIPEQPSVQPEKGASNKSLSSRDTVPPTPTAPAPGAGQSPSDTSAQTPAGMTLSAEPAAEPTPEPAVDSQTVAKAAPDQRPASAPPAPAQASPPSPAPAARETEPAPPPKPRIQEPFTIQVGAYRNKVYAEKMLTSLTRKGYKPYLFEDTDAKSRAWYNVRFGRFATRQAAQWALSAYRDKERKEAVIARTGVR